MSYSFSHNGFKINYELSPSPIDENIVLIHGNLASRLWWHPLINLWSQDKSGLGTVVNLDWRGFGKSKGLTTEEEIDFHVYASDIKALLQHLDLKKAHLVGHSTGGLLATLLTLKNPELVSSVTLLDSVGPWGLKPELPVEQVYAHFQKMSEDVQYCTQVLAATIHGVAIDDPFFLKLRNEAYDCDPVCWQGVIRKLFNFTDVSDAVQAKWKSPTLILHGEKDLVLPLKGSEQMNQIFKDSQLIRLPDQGHSCNVENPNKLSELLFHFWQNLN